jgi:putative two-component system response regulator
MILEQRGRHFDLDVLDAFMELSEEFRKIALEHADFEEERMLLSA